MKIHKLKFQKKIIIKIKKGESMARNFKGLYGIKVFTYDLTKRIILNYNLE